MGVKIAYVVGAARSGSTLLTNLLGELDGFLAASEMRLVWTRMHERLCGCGLPVWECPVWSVGLHRVKRELGDADPARIIRLQEQTTRGRHLREVLASDQAIQPLHTPRSAMPRLDTYGHVMRNLYLGLAEASGARVIVDSSKAPAEAALLRRLPDVEPYLIHLVRDPRAVAYSWQRALRKRQQTPPKQAAVRTAGTWVVRNSASELVASRYGAERSILVRYEDVVRAPGVTLQRLADLIGEPAGEMAFLTDPTVERTSRHMVGGNALRFGTSVVQLREDTEWQTQLTATDRASVTALTLPLLPRYRYPIRPPAPHAQAA